MPVYPICFIPSIHTWKYHCTNKKVLGKDMLGQHLHRYKSLANGPGAFFLVTASTITCLDSCSSFLSVSPMPFIKYGFLITISSIQPWSFQSTFGFLTIFSYRDRRNMIIMMVITVIINVCS